MSDKKTDRTCQHCGRYGLHSWECPETKRMFDEVRGPGVYERLSQLTHGNGRDIIPDPFGTPREGVSR